jgi:alkanesulfonate monooxygenase SsuD/methylene tetrahydromethanopterin reductase-like flavin-dependent oxidoreductase (luciferase family)
MTEGIDALRLLFEQPHSTYDGKYRRFRDVESYPKPVQSPLPIFSGGNAKNAIRRAGERCQGWLPAKLGPSEIAAGRGEVAEHARAAGRDPADITIGLQTVVCLAETADKARERLEQSTFELFRSSLQDTMMKGVDLDKYVADNLIGTPEQVCAKVAAFKEAGLDGFYATLFVANTVDEMVEQLRLFAQYVIPAFP